MRAATMVVRCGMGLRTAMRRHSLKIHQQMYRSNDSHSHTERNACPRLAQNMSRNIKQTGRSTTSTPAKMLPLFPGAT